MSNDLQKIESFSGRKGPLLLVILDGVGIGKQDDSDGVHLAKTPCLDALMASELYTTLKAHGTAVGMPSDDDMGNSEVGHNALGAGRVFAQGAKLVNNSIADESIFKTDTWQQLVANVRDQNGTFHLLGLLSDGNVHAHINHYKALLTRLAKEGVERVRIHVLLDGRDVFERSALQYIKELEDHIKKLKNVDYRIASGGGRMTTTMDRYNADWSMVEKGWKTHVLGDARYFSSATEAVQTYYNEDPKVNDQYLDSFVVAENDCPIGTIENGDSVVFMNFRGDRAIEMSMAFEGNEHFSKFERQRVPKVMFAGMLQYDGDLKLPKNFLVNPPVIERAVSTYICGLGYKSFAISETQKYGHVTYFWNGNKSGYVNKDLETYVEIPSDNVPFDQKPKMKAAEIADKAIELLKTGEYKFGRLNFPNGDMVGHTGVMDAVIESLEATDDAMARLIKTVSEMDGIVLVLADHGNADEMFTVKNGEKKISTAHSLNPVPCAIIDKNFDHEYKIANIDDRGLSNVAATLLNLLGYKEPEDYDPSLITFS